MRQKGVVTRTLARIRLSGKMAYDDLVCPPSVPACDHPARRLAVYAFHAQLSRRRGSASGARSGYLLRNGAAMGFEVWAVIRGSVLHFAGSETVYPRTPQRLEELDRAALLDAFDRQRQVDQAGRLVARHFQLGHPTEQLIVTLALAVLREDAGFHAYQMLEAEVRQLAVWGDTDEGEHILIAVARYLGAHSPTERATLQTADIARRLMRGGELHQGAEAS